jgi:hypothetical protein
MKIESGFSQPLKAIGESSPQVLQDQKFETLLRNTCETSAGARFTGNASEAAGIREAGRSLDVKPNEQVAVLQAEKVLDMLDVYRENLADESIPLQNIRPLVDEIHNAAGRLDKSLGGVKAGFGAGEIIREISALAHREILRYRGA